MTDTTHDTRHDTNESDESTTVQRRVTGVLGDGVRVMTAWEVMPEAAANGMKIGMNIRGWRDVEIEERPADGQDGDVDG